MLVLQNVRLKMKVTYQRILRKSYVKDLAGKENPKDSRGTGEAIIFQMLHSGQISDDRYHSGSLWS